MITLVIGLPGTGKTSYAKNHLRDGLCYDLDYLASAFRLRNPHEERHDAAIRMANDIAFGFYRNAREYAENIIIIRAAPSIEEVEEIKPDKIIVMQHEYQTKRAVTIQHKRTRLLGRIYDVIQWASRNKIILEYPPGQNPQNITPGDR